MIPIFVYVIIIVAGITFFTACIYLLSLTNALFKHLEKMQPEYYIKKGSPNLQFGVMGSVPYSRQFNANKYIFSVLFGKVKSEMSHDDIASKIINKIRRVWYQALLPSWILWVAVIIYLGIKFPNGVS